MTQTQEEKNAPLATERVEQVLTRAGGQLGNLAGRTMLRLRQVAQTVREEADRMDAPASPHQSHNGRVQPVMERAEGLVDQLGQRVGRWALIGSIQARRLTARLQEEAEDIWVEAQDMHREWQGKREQV